MIPSSSSRGGFTLVEVLMGAVMGTLVLTGIYTLWKNHQEQAARLQAKIEARNQLALSAKTLNRAITLAGLGMSGVPGIAKEDAVGTDTLILYVNALEASTGLAAKYHGGQNLSVRDAGIFAQAKYVGISDGTHGEICGIAEWGSTLVLKNGLAYVYDTAGTRVYPAAREKLYTDQGTETLVYVTSSGTRIAGKKVRNFQASFRDGGGNATEDFAHIRAVHFSLTGVFPAKGGTVNSVVYTSTVIPRNLM